MRNNKFVIPFLSSSSAIALALAVASAPASAQEVPMTIDTSEAAPAPISPAGGRPAAAAAAAFSGPAAAEAGADAEPENFYYGDYLDEADDTVRPAKRTGGVVPATHKVQSGDTLWDLSSYYFADAWHWPKVWGLNPEISNPHWIYPGNIVRLREGGATPTADPTGEFAMGASQTRAPQRSFGFHQMAYLDSQDLKDAATVDGSTDPKSLLSTGDSIYLTYPEGKTPKVGATYNIYSKQKDVGSAGAYVLVKGALQVTFAKKGKRARAIITQSNDPVERGMRVGPLKLKFGNIMPVPNSKKVDGAIVDVLGPDQLIGAQAAVIVNRGTNDGVKDGNRFLVLRRGDAYQEVMRPSSEVAQDDDKYPARAIGEVIVVQAGKEMSLGFVTFSIHEFEPGDRVYMRKGQ